MSETQTPTPAAPSSLASTPPAAAEKKGKIPAELLKLVKRPEVKDGKVVTRKEKGEEVAVLRAIAADEVFAWAEHEDEVSVVTVDGQNYRGEKPAKKA